MMMMMMEVLMIDVIVIHDEHKEDRGD